MAGALNMLLGAGAGSATISSPWDNILVVSPSSTGEAGDRTVSFSGSRTITADEGAYPLEYSVNGGGWTAYSAGFSFSGGDTLNWRATVNDNNAEDVNVYVDGVLLDTFQASGIGF